MKKDIITMLVALVILVVAGFFYLVYVEDEAKDPQANQTTIEVNFKKSGNIVRHNPGLKPNTWYLISEEPGKPAVTNELKFDANSKLVIAGQQKAYADVEIKVGARVEIEGYLKDGVVQVTKLTTSEEVSRELVTIKLFYYNKFKDKTDGCDVDAVLPVERRIQPTNTPIQDAINLLIKGDLQAEEKLLGFTTEFPNKDFKLLGANLKNGVLTLEFTEVPGFTMGGSCRVGLLTSQIIKTAKQFPEVKQVIFKPEYIFQP